MKRKALLVVILCLMGLSTISIDNVEAAGSYTCTVNEIGSSNSDTYIVVTDTAPTPAFQDTPFIIDTSSATQCSRMYAAGLTAFANSTYVKIYVNSIASWSTTYIVSATK